MRDADKLAALYNKLHPMILTITGTGARIGGVKAKPGTQTQAP